MVYSHLMDKRHILTSIFFYTNFKPVYDNFIYKRFWLFTQAKVAIVFWNINAIYTPWSPLRFLAIYFFYTRIYRACIQPTEVFSVSSMLRIYYWFFTSSMLFVIYCDFSETTQNILVKEIEISYGWWTGIAVTSERGVKISHVAHIWY